MSEHDEQVAVVRWCAWRSIPVFAIPNGGYRPKATAKRLKDEGVEPGVPDLFIPVSKHGKHGLFLEMKDRRGAKPRPEQMEWLELLDRNGYVAAWARGADAAIELIERYFDD